MSEAPGETPKKRARKPRQSTAKTQKQAALKKKRAAAKKPQTGNGVVQQVGVLAAANGEDKPDPIETLGGPSKGASDNAVLDWLTSLPRLQRDRMRKAVAQRLGVRVTALEPSLKERARPKPDDSEETPYEEAFPENRDDCIRYLAELSELAYALQRIAAAAYLNIPVTQLDIAVRAMRERLRDERKARKAQAVAAQRAAKASRRGFSVSLPELIVNYSDLSETVRELRDILANADDLYDRGGFLVQMIKPADGGMPFTKLVTHHNVVMLAHEYCRPVSISKEGEYEPVTLPERVAKMYVDLGSWNLRPLAGITSAPLINDNGTIEAVIGYSPKHMLWCEAVPGIDVPDRPAKEEADRALLRLRNAFRTFPFKDAIMLAGNISRVDTSQPPGVHESGFLNALLTAVARPSLWLAPGVACVAPLQSGAGNGKGLLVRCICVIAYGIEPEAFTPGHDRDELDKRIVSAVVSSQQMVFLDNVNATALRSNTLASLQTERPSRVRILGRTGLVPVYSAALFMITGNGLTLSEDLCRRNLWLELDAEMEDAEQRSFPRGFKSWVKERREALLADCLTIMRWGRQNPDQLKRGTSLGSFEDWAELVRDPLLTLGCKDPVDQIVEAKKNDPMRGTLNSLFTAWWDKHQDTAIKASQLDPAVLAILNPANRSRQWVAARLIQLTGTRAAGYVLTRSSPDGTWSPDTYALAEASNAPGRATRASRQTDPEADEGSWPAALPDEALI
jgi:hypothetical protein